jgi:hypothetical protein
MDTVESSESDNSSITITESESRDVNAANLKQSSTDQLKQSPTDQLKQSSTDQLKQSSTDRKATKSRRVKLKRKSFTVEFKIKSVEEFNKWRKAYPAQRTSTYLRQLNSINGTNISKTSFNEWRREFADKNIGILNGHRKKLREGDYPELESFLVKYLEKREALFKTDKLGLSYDYIRELVLDEAERLSKLSKNGDYNDFKASNRWIANVIKRNQFVGMRAHGEGGDVDETASADAIATFKEECM